MKEIFLAKEGEIALKGLNKKTFENVLMKNIRYALSEYEGVNVHRAQSVIYIQVADESRYNAAYDRLTKVFGINALCRAALCEKDFDVIKTAAVDYIRGKTAGVRTFKVEAKRADKKFPLDSPAISRELGGYILEQIPHLSVDVHKPDLTVNIEIREEHCYIHTGNVQAAGGLPVGTSGYALGLLSGGIDSPVALYMIAKRGVKTATVHFEAPPYTSERAKLKVISLAQKIAAYNGGMRFFCVPFTEIQEKLRDGLSAVGEDGYFTIIMRRLMLSIAERIAEKEGFDALITGESIGQVASQTMGALTCTNVCEIPVFRPLIGMDKSEIVKISERIDTFETSSLPYEDCCTVFTPKHPRTHPKRDIAEKLQADINFGEMIEAAVKNTEIIHIKAES
ncbi:MAG: tRNA 4-thiouridine(8) synthase ThiI [Ruminococcus sp.]|nr:tRNA 4-thiouridine(8) synthase ThiI [Ruminococcus sp.]